MNELAEQHFQQADELYRKGCVPESIAEWRQAIEASPDWSEAHRRLGVTLWYNGDVAGAIAEYREAIRLDPRDAQPHVSLGFALSKEGRTEEAIAEYRRATACDPTHVVAHLHLSTLYFDAGDNAAAATEAREVLRLDPNKAGARVNLATMMSLSGDQDGAISELRMAVESEPMNADLYTRLGDCLLEQAGGRPDADWGAVRDAYQKAVSLGAQSVNALSGLAYMQWHFGEKATAVRTMEAAVAKSDQYIEDAYVRLCKMQLRTGRLRGAWRTVRIITENRHPERVS